VCGILGCGNGNPIGCCLINPVTERDDGERAERTCALWRRALQGSGGAARHRWDCDGARTRAHTKDTAGAGQLRAGPSGSAAYGVAQGRAHMEGTTGAWRLRTRPSRRAAARWSGHGVVAALATSGAGEREVRHARGRLALGHAGVR
jgi:hypothetical protein